MTPLLLTTLATGADERAAVSQTLQQLAAAGAKVRGGLLFATGDCSPQALWAELSQALRDIPFLGTGGARALATEKGSAEGRALAGLWLVGEGFGFATACASGTEAGSRALDEALQRGGMKRFKVRMAVAHVAGAAGHHVELLGERLARVRAVLGAAGSAVFTNDQLIEDGVGVALCDWPWQLGCALDSGFAPTSSRGRITCARPGEIGAIDGKDALELYARWSGESPDGPEFAAHAELQPLGLVRGTKGGEPAFVLARPSRAADGRGLASQVDADEGHEVALMAASSQALAGQAAKAAERARKSAGFSPTALAGALALADLPSSADRPAVTRGLAAALEARPFVLVFGGALLGSVVPRRLERCELATSALVLSSERDLAEGA